MIRARRISVGAKFVAYDAIWWTPNPAGIIIREEFFGSTIEGSLAVQETRSDSASFVGTVFDAPIEGILVVQESTSDTALFDGELIATATFSVQETGEDIAVISGSVIISGSLSISELRQDTSSFSGQVLIDGSLIVQESGVDSATFVGSVLIDGSLQITEVGSDIFSANGVLINSGSLIAQEVGSDSASFEGTVTTLSVTMNVTEFGSDVSNMNLELLVPPSFVAFPGSIRVGTLIDSRTSGTLLNSFNSGELLPRGSQMSEFIIKRGDRSPSLIYQLSPVIDLTGCIIRFNMRTRSGLVILNRVTADVHDDPVDGIVRYDWSEESTSVVGQFLAEFEVTLSDGRASTWPNNEYIRVRVFPDIA